MGSWTDLQAAFAAGKISRRTFLSGATTLGLAAAAASIVGAPMAKAATPKKGGVLKLGLAGGSTTDSWDPRSYTEIA
jgi:peptide/nickel transport system substrate-binding protein